jgi:hypothetical protein
MAQVGTTWRRAIAATLAAASAAVLAFETSSLATATSAHHASTVEARIAVVGKRPFHDAMRRLWVDHVTWTRLFIGSFVADLPDLQATTDRLLQNQVDIGEAVKPFYGEVAGDELTQLLTEHILTAADLPPGSRSGGRSRRSAPLPRAATRSGHS